ncbi:Hypothetical protein J6896_04875 [Nakaseomyces glabratus]|nr:hypothetical protein J7298_04879 [Nakaseomyces glabratus]KAH7592660.1 hypothetical protein J7295_04873 [Nakaseomyces glabratus]KAH7610505.1 hypothetical protein J7292_04850 [Nakaseomyces glabratus]
MSLVVDKYIQLHQEYRILHLLNHRNKNQHRVATWWKWFNMLRRSVGDVVEILQPLGRTKNQKLKDKKDGRFLYRTLHKFFQMESKLYYSFNNIIKLGQFITLGVVLVGILGRVHSIYHEIFELYKEQFISIGCLRVPKKNAQIEEAHVTTNDNEELGELINDADVLIEPSALLKQDVIPSENIKNESKSSKDKKKKKKKKKGSAIDDLFG